MAVTYRTQEQFAKAIGITRQALAKLLLKEDWPTRKKPAWGQRDLQAVKQWRKLHLQEDRSAPDAGETDGGGDDAADPNAPLFAKPKSIEQQLKAERIQDLRFRRERQAGLLIKRSIFDAAVIALANRFVDELGNLVRNCSIQLADQRPDQIERTLNEHVRSLRERLAAETALQVQVAEKEGAGGK